MKFADYFKNKVVTGLSVIVTLFAIVAGIWSIDDHYATNKRVNLIEVAYAEDMKKIGEQLSKTLENTQHKLDARYFQFMMDNINNNIYEIKRQIKKDPDDKILLEDLKETYKRRKVIKDKLNKSLESIR